MANVHGTDKTIVINNLMKELFIIVVTQYGITKEMAVNIAHGISIVLKYSPGCNSLNSFDMIIIHEIWFIMVNRNITT